MFVCLISVSGLIISPGERQDRLLADRVPSSDLSPCAQPSRSLFLCLPAELEVIMRNLLIGTRQR